MRCRKCGNELTAAARFCPECGTDQSGSAATPVVQEDPRIGTSIEGKYRLDAQIGIGGMATVYRATRVLIGDAVAVKILHAEQLREPEAAERFRREAQAAARLKHANAVTIYDFGVSADGVVYLVMELVEGDSLRKVVRSQGPLPLATTTEILSQVCGALNEAHEQNVVHRDIKPDNILVTVTPSTVRVKVLDFGIARIGDMSTLGNLTQTGSIMGTPHYMSPEQCLGEELDGRSDIYSLGVVAYEMLTGAVPFDSPTSMAVAVHHVNTVPASLRTINSTVPTAVESVVMRALEKRRENRPQTASELATEFAAAVSGTSGASAGKARGSAAPVPPMMPTVQMRTPFAVGATVPPRADTAPASPGARIEQTPQKRLPLAALAAAAVVMLAAAGGGAYFLTREDPAPHELPAAAATLPATSAVANTQNASRVAASAPEQAPSPPVTAAIRTPPAPSAAANTGTGGPSADSDAVPEKGDITIRLLPGSTVHVDGTNVGTAGPEGVLVLPRLRAGRHLLVVRKERYRDVERTIAIVPGQAEVIEIQPLPVSSTETTTAAAVAPVARHEGDHPAIAELSVDRSEVDPGQGATLRVSASDSNPDSLKYTWSSTAGTIDGRGTVASFRAPSGDSQATAATVTVTARNGRGLEAKRDIVIKLKSRAPAATVTPDAMRRRAYAIGANIEVWLESPKKGDTSGTVDTELTMVDNVWQVTSVQGNLPGVPVVITPECHNCEFLGIVESPNPANGFMRVRLRVKPVSPQQPMGVQLRYQPPAPAKKK